MEIENKKIMKVREDIRKAEAKAREVDEYIKTLRAKERQLEDDAIIAEIRAMQEKGGDVLDVLHRIKRDEKTQDEQQKERGGREIEL